jgi:hypothetical protein
MKRPYLALATLALVAGLPPGQVSGVRANGLFSSAPVESASFAVLARPVGDDDWTLVVLEQLRARPFCWTPRPDGLVDPTLNRFDYTGICGRFIDSNGYSLRIGEADLGHAYRLRVQRRGRDLQLLAATASRGAELLVGRGTVPRRDRDLFVSLQLEPGWELQRRMFGARSLNHVYFANGQPLDRLIATARGRTTVETGFPGGGPLSPPAAPPPLTASEGDPLPSPRRNETSSPGEVGRQARGTRGGRQLPSSWSPAPAPAAVSDTPAARETPADGSGSGVVALQVIPYEERNTSAQGQ